MNMEDIIKLLYQQDCSCVIYNRVVRIFNQHGVADLYELLNQEADFLQGSSVADKVIGKAAAVLLISGGVKEIYADIISETALTLLQEASIKVSFGQRVNHIENRNHTGWCPLETLCYRKKSVPEILLLIREFMEAKTSPDIAKKSYIH